MHVSQVYDELCQRMTNIELHQRSAKNISEKEYSRVVENHEKVLELGYSEKNLKSYDRMSFKDAKNGDYQFYGKTIRSVHDIKASILYHRNKQYQWMLAEAYEQYEIFLYGVYASLGGLEMDVWPLCDYGSKTAEGIEGHDWGDYFVLAKKKRNSPGSILNVLRLKFPEIAQVENNNAFGINLKFLVSLIELMRHVIVHKSGVVDDRQVFIELVFNKSGLSENDELTNVINFFFAYKNKPGVITLLERPDQNEIDGIPLPFYQNVYSQLVGYLMAHAQLITESINQGNNANHPRC